MTQTQNIPGNNCIICERWQKTPYFKRHTTPTTAQDTETAMVLGYWVASRRDSDLVARMCERHSVYLFQLDTIENAREAQTLANAESMTPGQQAQRHAFEQRALDVTRHLSAPLLKPPVTPPLAPVGEVLGVGTGVSQAAVPEPLAHLSVGQPGGFIMPPPTSSSQQMLPTPEAPKEGEGPSFPCPICGKMTRSGAVHECA